MQDLTDGKRLYVIGDIHGCLRQLDDVVARIRADIAARPHPEPEVLFLGDYVDRGPDSSGVIARLIELRDAPDLTTTFMIGNHDTYIAAYLANPEWFDRSIHWLHPRMGGDETLASYGVEDATPHDATATRDAFAAAIPQTHLDFIANCREYRRIGGYLFVHAGIRPGVLLEKQIRDDLIWIREPFLRDRRDYGFKVVHGHTVVEDVEHHKNRIAIDTGAVFTGRLTCLLLEGDAAFLLEKAGLTPLPEGFGTGLSKFARRVRGGLFG